MKLFPLIDGSYLLLIHNYGHNCIAYSLAYNLFKITIALQIGHRNLLLNVKYHMTLDKKKSLPSQLPHPPLGGTGVSHIPLLRVQPWTRLHAISLGSFLSLGLDLLSTKQFLNFESEKGSACQPLLWNASMILASGPLKYETLNWNKQIYSGSFSVNTSRDDAWVIFKQKL